MDERICKMTPEGLELAFGLIVCPFALLADLALWVASEVGILIVVRAGIAGRVNDIDVERGFCGSGPVVETTETLLSISGAVGGWWVSVGEGPV